ncbi:MAG: 50S ribosomal protein L2 [Candidatus Moranbacteria bacterium]|nr:50S ribosomal protein L2 [Candidatus Moranbacteria bacterium]
MAIKIRKIKNQGKRTLSFVASGFDKKKKPEKSLLFGKNRKIGRMSSGKISVRHRGGGHKKRLRRIDFECKKIDISAKVIVVEKDPNRSGFIALLVFTDGEKRYVLSWQGAKAGDKIIFSRDAEIKKGNRTILSRIPVGTEVFNVEMVPGKGGQIVRSAGSAAIVMANENGFTQLQLPSTEIRIVPDQCMATIGRVSNIEHNTITIGKAGRVRWMGRRPQVRGKVMNPIDHPHGGGEGNQPIGLKNPKTPWGKPAKGLKTRQKFKASDKYILRRRKKKRRK